MTAYILFAMLKSGKIKLDEKVYISDKAAAKGGSRMFIKAGSEVAVEDLMRGIIVSSGNDASIAIAEHIAGSEEAFADLMNDYATKLGMHDTNFVNATGWPDEEHYTTSKDIAVMSLALIKNFPEYYKIFAEKSFTYGKSPRAKDITQPNRNDLLWKKSFKVDGIKTGHTEAAGYCLAASAVKNDVRLISVVMGTKSKQARVKYSQELLNYGFRHYRSKKIYTKGQEVQKVRIYKGEVEELKVGAGKDMVVTTERLKADGLTTNVTLDTPISAPVIKGQKLGNIAVMADGDVLAEFPLVALEEVNEGGIFDRLWDSLLLYAGW